MCNCECVSLLKISKLCNQLLFNAENFEIINTLKKITVLNSNLKSLTAIKKYLIGFFSFGI